MGLWRAGTYLRLGVTSELTATLLESILTPLAFIGKSRADLLTYFLISFWAFLLATLLNLLKLLIW